MPRRVDIHQHLWPRPFLDALRARRWPPRLDGWTLHLPDERPWPIDPAAHEVTARRRQAEADGDDLVLVAMSCALGVDRLPPAEAEELVCAWHEGAATLPAPFGWWAAAGVQEPDPEGLAEALAAGAAGLEVAADEFAAPGGLDRLAPLLDVLAAHDRPLLVHPGPAGAQDGPSRPPWWAAVVSYTAQLQSAWWAWVAAGRAAHPGLRVCFAALAGLAPLHAERHRSRGGHAAPVDPLTYVETSTYGTKAIDATIRVLGVDVVCHGSDRPYAAPPAPDLGAAAMHALRTTNPGRLLAPALQEVPVTP